MTNQRFVKAEKAAWLGIVANIFLAVLKGVIGWTSRSQALIADAAHSASDVAGSFAVLIGLRAAKLPPDEDHPYGHGKAEPIAAIVVSVILLVVGVDLGITSIKSIFHGVHHAPATYALYAILISIVLKEVLFQYKYRLGKKISSQALITNAWEHRSDVYSSIAALIGVGGAIIGKFVNMPILYYLDPAAGFLVSLLVIHMGYRLVMDAIHSTLDHVLHDEDAKELVETVQTIRGCISVDEMRAREHGYYVVVDIKISVDPKITVLQGHDIAKEVKQVLIKKFSHVSDVFVHVNPYDPSYPYKSMNSDHDDYPHLLH